MLSYTILPAQRDLPRGEDGKDWGRRRRLIAESADRMRQLFIVPGHRYRSGAWGTEYAQTVLVLHDRRGRGYDGIGDWLAYGRISDATLRAHAAKIDKVFGDGATAHMDVRKTLIFEEKP